MHKPCRRSATGCCGKPYRQMVAADVIACRYGSFPLPGALIRLLTKRGSLLLFARREKRHRAMRSRVLRREQMAEQNVKAVRPCQSTAYGGKGAKGIGALSTTLLQVLVAIVFRSSNTIRKGIQLVELFVRFLLIATMKANGAKQCKTCSTKKRKTVAASHASSSSSNFFAGEDHPPSVSLFFKTLVTSCCAFVQG